MSISFWHSPLAGTNSEKMSAIAIRRIIFVFFEIQSYASSLQAAVKLLASSLEFQ